MKRFLRLSVLVLALALAFGSFALADEPFQYEEGNRWGSSADRIDQYLDTAFEQYLAGENSAAYDSVNNAYFKVYETTGFERQTMTYISGPRKNAVELEYTTCKAMVKKTETDDETKGAVRSELNKLKTMIREDANKLAAKDGEPQTEMSYWQNGVRVAEDPWSELAGEGGGLRYASWAEANDAISDMVSTLSTEYRGRAYEDATATFDNMYFSVYWGSGFAGKVYEELGYDQWKDMDDRFMAVREILASGKYQSTAFGNAQKKLSSGIKNCAARLDRIAAISKIEDGKAYTSWTGAYEDFETLSQSALAAIENGDQDGLLKRSVEAAYQKVWIDSGLRARTEGEVSKEDAERIENGFALVRDAVSEGVNETTYDSVSPVLSDLNSEIKAAIERLDEIDKASETRNTDWLTALGAFGIIVREGLEAILVIAAIIAYLVKSGNAKALKHVYLGAALGIVASFIAAAALYFLKKAFTAAGMAQEIIEGVTALIAVCVLFYVSNWMISKSEAAAWTGYLNQKVQSGVERNSSFALAFTAFLSVFREGAEVVLFYQPMMAGEEGSVGMVLAGFLVGCVVLVGVYLAITKLSIKLPIKVFFTATSILMAIMCVAFLGSGIKELSEGGLFECTLRVTGVPENDVVQVLGIYPFLETLVPQLILAVILLITFMMAHYRNKITVLTKEYEMKLNPPAASEAETEAKTAKAK